jgi:hypothetical protein
VHSNGARCRGRRLSPWRFLVGNTGCMERLLHSRCASGQLIAEQLGRKLEEGAMMEIEKLMWLHGKLIGRRRRLVGALANTDVEQLSGNAVSRIQNAIEAVNSAITQEEPPDLRRRADCRKRQDQLNPLSVGYQF